MNPIRPAIQHAYDALSRSPKPSLAELGAARIAVAFSRAAATPDERDGILEIADSALGNGLALLNRHTLTTASQQYWAREEIGSALNSLQTWLCTTAEPDLTIPGILAEMRRNGLHAQANEVDRLLTAVGAGGVGTPPLREK